MKTGTTKVPQKEKQFREHQKWFCELYTQKWFYASRLKGIKNIQKFSIALLIKIFLCLGICICCVHKT